MVKLKTLYTYLNEKIPQELSCDWDNDGLMCALSPDKEINRVLLALDITQEVVEHAVQNGFDIIISHHPLIFHPLSAVNYTDSVSRRVMSLIRNDIAAFSFHTRLDAMTGGVNDVLASKLGLENTEVFENIGRTGSLSEEMTVEAFAKTVKEKLCCDKVTYVDGGQKVRRVTLIGGSGKGYLECAIKDGVDTFVTGEMPYDAEITAKENGINLILAGHYFTENGICNYLEKLLSEYDSSLYVEKKASLYSVSI